MPVRAFGPLLSVLYKWPSVSQAYKWDKNDFVAEWLESQLNADASHSSIVTKNLRCVKRDAVIHGVKESLEVRREQNDAKWWGFGTFVSHGHSLCFYQGCPEAAVDAVVEMARSLSQHQRELVLRSISQLEDQSNDQNEQSQWLWCSLRYLVFKEIAMLFCVRAVRNAADEVITNISPEA